MQAVQGERTVLGDRNWGNEEEAKKRKKSRKSLGRRVSFAPDAHLYPQVVDLELACLSVHGFEVRLAMYS